MENNRQEHNYIDILKDSLTKKKLVLENILKENEEQRKIAQAEKFDYDSFDECYDRKGKLISELNLLDSGFESIYERVSDVLTSKRDEYREDIIVLKSLVKQVTELSMEIEASEKRNKELIEKATSGMQNEIKTARVTTKAASDYYHSMNKLNVIDPQFMDKKK